MKQILSVLCCIICITTFSQGNQQEGFIKTFPGNESVTYATNSKYVNGLAFYHKFAKDTINQVFYIEGFKYSDVKILGNKVKMTFGKLCMPGYKSNPGDLIYTMDEESEIIYYYHLRKEDMLEVKFN